MPQSSGLLTFLFLGGHSISPCSENDTAMPSAGASESYAPSVLVSTEGLPEKDWLEYRRRGIGGSDATAI